MTKVIVYHRGYGCDTGCCGHAVAIERDDGREEESFEFTHPYDEDPRAFAERLVTEEFGVEHIVDLDWENSFIHDD
jgi:hypothetical protein